MNKKNIFKVLFYNEDRSLKEWDHYSTLERALEAKNYWKTGRRGRDARIQTVIKE